jgi:hypothetical protein
VVKSRVVATEGRAEMRNSRKIFVGKPVGKKAHIDLDVDRRVD